MTASLYAGRAGGLAVALGIGTAILSGGAGAAWSSPADEASGSTAESAGPRVGKSRADNATRRVGPAGAPTGRRAHTVSAVPRPAAANADGRLKPVSGPAAKRPRIERPQAAQAVSSAPAEAGAARAAGITAPQQLSAEAAGANPLGSFFGRWAALFNNQTPRLNPTQVAQNPAGVVTGELNAVDPDSPRLTFTVSAQPAHGTAAVSTDGSWTYTPEPAATAAGVVDSFRVTVSDAASGFAIHGLAGLLNMLTFGLIGQRGDSSTSTVTVTVTPIGTANTAPTGTFVVDSTDSSTGVVRGRVLGSDPDGDALGYSGSATTAKGAVVVTAAGAFTYTPTADARHRASALTATGAERQDGFTVTVSDGRGGTAAVAVTVAVSPANVAPVAGTPVVGSPNPTTGVVTGSVGGTDADGDVLTYGAPAATPKGSVVVNAGTGGFTYTPSAAARQNAAAPGATPADRADTFTVTLTDGHGGTATAAVTVAVAGAEIGEPSVTGQLRAADLALEGFFRVPTGAIGSGEYATLAYGGTAMASRVVDGRRTFFLTGHRYANDPLVELAAPTMLGTTPDTSPVATVVRYWGDIYGGRKVTDEEPDGSQPNANWTEGLLWDEANQRVLWSYGNWYAASHVNNPVIGATTLAPDGSVTVHGPWRTTADSQQTRSFAMFLSEAVSASAGGATLGLGGKMQSINATASWGPSLHVIDSPTGTFTEDAIPSKELIAHPIAPTDRRTPRDDDYQVARNPDGSLDAAGTEPAVDDVGFWTELDETTGAAFVHNGSGERAALVYSGGQATGLIWYGPDLEHGVADGRGYSGKGNHSQGYRPVLWFVSEADVVASAEGRLAPDAVNPYLTVDLLAQFPELAFLTGLSAGQPVFAADEGRLYVPFPGGSTADREPYPLIAVFSVAD